MKNNFSLKEIDDNIHSFADTWVGNMKMAFGRKRVFRESISANKITFSIASDGNFSLEEFDEIATDCMPDVLVTLLDWCNMNFDYKYTYGDNEPIDDYVYVDFVVW